MTTQASQSPPYSGDSGRSCISPFCRLPLLAAFALAWACGSKDRAPTNDPLQTTGGSGGSMSSDAGSLGSAGGADSGGAAGASGASGAAGSASADAGAGGGPEAPDCIVRAGCETLCGALSGDPAACGVGNAQQCGCICEDRFNGPCPDELSALLACTGEAPSIDCSLRGRVFAGCEDESIALEVCDFRAREALCADDFPACAAYCRAATLSFCPRGPESVTSCLCGCEATLATLCESEFAAFMSCANDAPSFTCAESGRPEAVACSAEWEALDGCVRPPASAPDAG